MKVFMLSNPAAIHTQRWVSALAKRGVEIMLYSFYPCEKGDYYRGIKHVQVKSVVTNSVYSAVGKMRVSMPWRRRRGYPVWQTESTCPADA